MIALSKYLWHSSLRHRVERLLVGVAMVCRVLTAFFVLPANVSQASIMGAGEFDIAIDQFDPESIDKVHRALRSSDTGMSGSKASTAGTGSAPAGRGPLNQWPVDNGPADQGPTAPDGQPLPVTQNVFQGRSTSGGSSSTSSPSSSFGGVPGSAAVLTSIATFLTGDAPPQRVMFELALLAPEAPGMDLLRPPQS